MGDGVGAVASRRTRGPVDKISLGPLSSLSQISSVVFRISRVFRIVWMIYGVLCQRPAHHSECHDNVYYPEQTLPLEGRFCRDYLFLGAINALTRLPSPECDARIKWVFSCDLIFIPKFFGLPDTPPAHSFTEQPTALTIWFLHRWWEAEPLPFYFHCPRMCMVVFHRKCVYCHSRLW